MWRDDARLMDMLISARRAQEFLAGITDEDFLASPLHQHAVTRALEVLGEAARGVSEDRRRALPYIPWEDVIGMRSKLIHEYFHVKLDVVWGVVRNDLPALIEQLEASVPPE
jgi:uncharacterized protein with HEPN domain